MKLRPRLYLALLAVAWAASMGQAADAAEPRPNILFILVDDLRWDDLACAGNPFVKSPHIDRVAREGTRFLNAFVTTPLCSPSRASFLTGQYAHTHGIIDNTDRSAASHRLVTFPRLLHDAGYETGYIGKWHMGNDASPRPGFDDWLGMPGQGTSRNPALNDNGHEVKLNGYTTDLFTERALAFLRRPRSKPFFLYVSHKAIHPETEQRADGSLSDPTASNFIPADRHKTLYADAKIPRRPNALVAPQGKPALERPIPGVPPLGPATGSSDEHIRGRLRMLAAVDEGMGRIFAALEESHQLENTVIIVAGDNGYFYGEHGLSVERRLAYEESVRIPLIIRWPRVVRAGGTPEALVLNIDLAPTLLELAQIKVPATMQGQSLVPVLRGEAVPWRTSFLVEYWSDKVFPRVANMGYHAIRTERWKYVHYLELPGMDELYDLRADPFEMRNVIDDPNSRKARAEMESELARQLKETGAPARP
jgi:N-acetylglucosamine-6-sulfatase